MGRNSLETTHTWKMNEGGIDNAKQQSSGAALPIIGGCNVAVVVCQRRVIVHPQPRVAVLLARRLVNSADGDARCPEDAIRFSRLYVDLHHVWF